MNKDEDSELYFFVDKFSPVKITENDAIVKLTQIYNKEGHSNLTGSINSIDIDGQTASEILKKLRNSGNLIVHNSTQSQREIFYSGGAFPEVLETNFSLDDRRKINEAQTRFQNTVKRAAKQHKEELDKLLGRLNEKLQVELSPTLPLKRSLVRYSMISPKSWICR